ncbi:MAG: twin-arginine translocase TatA/TatE family subunit [Chloroflexi bacterium]|jgi:sec-independent protein translocase protein TatA|nr:twin-arginine translocase TatA/TatE family subunit [Chloroflexota bacterium]MCH8226433.1 twin-arginine translocase TatA/TatE family subunit [Chloroflexota bacterium]MCI0846853.1 twin-arginine translocase TatA/TatE family subunit [Chloroflexota bacterium]
MFRPGPEWVVIILVVLLVVFGAKRFPEMGSSLGRGIRAFKRSVTGEEEKAQSQEPGVKTGADDERT